MISKVIKVLIKVWWALVIILLILPALYKAWWIYVALVGVIVLRVIVVELIDRSPRDW